MEQLANLLMPALVTLGITIGIIFGVRYLFAYELDRVFADCDALR